MVNAILNISNLPGPDSMHSHILKECADSLTVPITELFSSSFNEMHVPVDSKSANISAIFKKGDKTIVSNHLPVSLTNVICKVSESVIKDIYICLISYLLDNDFICA